MFLGYHITYSVFIEKILRTVPDVGKIYILIKAKNTDAAMERLKNEVCDFILFLSSFSFFRSPMYMWQFDPFTYEYINWAVLWN